MFRRARLQPLSSSSSSSLPRDDVQDVHRADIRRNRRKTTVIGDNRFRPAWNKRQRGTKEWREKEARPTKEKKERKKEPTRIILRRVLKWNHRQANRRSSARPTLKTRNSNGSRSFWFRYTRFYFEEFEEEEEEEEEEETRPLSRG